MIEWSALKDYTQIPPKSVRVTDVEYPIRLREVVLSVYEVRREIASGRKSIVRRNMERKGYEVLPEWEDIVGEYGPE